jgi:hypothetical protein
MPSSGLLPVGAKTIALVLQASRQRVTVSPGGHAPCGIGSPVNPLAIT